MTPATSARQQQALQRSAELIARKTVRRMCFLRRGLVLFDYDDALSVGMIAGALAVGSWSDSRASFETHVITRVRTALLEAFRNRDYGAPRTRGGVVTPECISLEKRIREDEPETVADCIPDPVDAIAAVIDADCHAGTLRVLNWIPPREATVLRGLYLEGALAKEMAARLDLSSSRIVQLHRQALGRAREMLATGGLGS